MSVSRVEIVVPARNEERVIARTLRALLPSSPWPFRWHLTVADGRSGDATAAIASAVDPDNVSVVPNHLTLQSCGVNMVALSLPDDVDVVVRADAHCVYPPDFVASVVAALERSGADSVVVAMHSRSGEGSAFGRATAAAQNSRLGNGGASHRNAGRSGFVDHGHHAAFRREAFAALGGYDETFSHNEDAEFDLRMAAAGRKVFLDGGSTIGYLVRETPAALARQYFAYGAGRARTVLKHNKVRLRQIAPAVVTAGNAACLLLSPLLPWTLAAPALYAAACLALGAAASGAKGAERLAGIPAMIMHHAWGAGFLSTMARTMTPPAAIRLLGGLVQRAVP